MLADDYGEKGIAFPGMDAHIMKEIIIQHPIIYLFTLSQRKCGLYSGVPLGTREGKDGCSSPVL